MLTNPLFLFTIVWLGSIFLFELYLSEVLIEADVALISYLLASVFFFTIGFLSIKFQFNCRIRYSIEGLCCTVNSRKYRRFLIVSISLLIAVFLIEGIIFGGYPLLGLIGIGPIIHYTDFGVRGIHGLFNALFLTAFALLYLKLLINKKIGLNLKTLLLIILIAWPLFSLSRQLMFTLIIEILMLTLLVSKHQVSFKNFLKITSFVFILIFLFGYLGDLRSGRDAFLVLAQPTFEYPDWLPSGLMWVYIYIVSPINNLAFNFNFIEPNYLPINTLTSYFPSFLREGMLEVFGGNSYHWKLINENLNVSTFHEKILLDFGPYFAQLVFFIFGMVCAYFYLYRYKSIFHLIALIVLLHGIFFSFFVDFIFNLVFFAQIVIAYIFLKRLKIQNV